MNRFKCPACGGNQYTARSTAEWCIYCGHQKLKKKDMPAIEQGHKNARMGIRRPTYYQQNYCFSQERARGAVLGRGKREC